MLRRSLNSVCVLLTSSLVAWPSSASAQGQSNGAALITFVVPVDVKNLPVEVDHVQVDCELYNDPGMYGPGLIAGATTVLDSFRGGGSFKGDVVVRFAETNFDLGQGRKHKPSEARAYRCYLTYYQMKPQPQPRGSGTPDFPVQAGSISLVKGDVPQPENNLPPISAPKSGAASRAGAPATKW